MFKKGDVVKLKGANTKMTVEVERNDEGLVGCSWFDNFDLRREMFKEENLELV